MVGMWNHLFERNCSTTLFPEVHISFSTDGSTLYWYDTESISKYINQEFKRSKRKEVKNGNKVRDDFRGA